MNTNNHSKTFYMVLTETLVDESGIEIAVTYEFEKTPPFLASKRKDFRTTDLYRLKHYSNVIQLKEV